MKNSIFVYIAISSLFLVSCATLKTSTSKSLDIYGSGVIQKPVVADLNVVQTKVTGFAKETASQSVESVKQKAVADALKKSSADVLIEPKFETETKSGYTTALVSGWPATYSNFRVISPDDIPLLQAGILQKAEVYTPPTVEKKKGTGWLVATTIILLGLTAVVVANGY